MFDSDAKHGRMAAIPMASSIHKMLVLDPILKGNLPC
jgi:hypothetical protein